MKARLGLRVFALLAALNLVVFAGVGTFLTDRIEEQRAELVAEFREQIVATLEGTIQPQGGLSVARILDWPGWSNVAEALVVDRYLERAPNGRLSPRGVALHPKGQVAPVSRREPVLEGLAACMESGQRLAVAGGFAVPLVVEGRTWGGLWFAPRLDRTGADVSRLLWSGFAVSTALLLIGTFAALQPLVIAPVRRLASAASRVTAGDLAARVETSDSGDEMSELLQAFNRMAERVETLTLDLETEVADALQLARKAEAAALIQKRLAAMGELAAGIAHEINNPLGGLQNAVRSLQSADVAPERRERYLRLLADGLERIEGTVAKVLRMAPRQTDAAPVDLREVVRDAASLVRHRVEAAGHGLVGTLCGTAFDPCAGGELDPNDALWVIGARHELGQAVLNLFANALDALDERVQTGPGRLEVALDRRGRDVLLEVRDNGPGARPEDLDRLTDLFFSTKEVGKGTGLGLAIVHNVIDTHGGRLELAAPARGGFVATCVLPGAPSP